MNASEIRIKLMNDPGDRLLAFCSLTLDMSFVIRDLKIIQGGKGPFVAMPSRRLMDHCPRCYGKNHLRARFCNDCGARLSADRALRGGDGRAKLYADVAHPIHSECRDRLQQQILESYADELRRSKLPDYVCNYDDIDDLFGQVESEGFEPKTDFRGAKNYRLDEGIPDRQRSPHIESSRNYHLPEMVTGPGDDESFGGGIL